MNGKLRVEMHTGYKVFYIEDIGGIANSRMNEIILESLIFEFMDNNIIRI